MAKISVKVNLIEIRNQQLKVIGDLNNLNQNLLGILCSQKCPGELVLKGFDAARQVREEKRIVVSGFHSPMEKDIFDILVRGTQPVIMCIARNIDHYRIPASLEPMVESARLTIIAPVFSEKEKRITRETAEQRNKLIIGICDQVLLIHAQPDGNLERVCYQNLPNQKRIFTLPSERNEHLFKQGVLQWEGIR